MQTLMNPLPDMNLIELDYPLKKNTTPFSLNTQRPTKIAIDITSTLADPWPIIGELTEDRWGFRLEKEHQYSWNGGHTCIKHLFNKDVEIQELKSFFYEVWDYWQDIPPTEKYVKELWKDLNQMELDVNVVTSSRTEELIENKTKWIARNFSSLVPINNAYPEEKYELDYDIFLDDNPNIIAGASVRNKMAIVYSQPWNLGLTGWTYTYRANKLMDAVLFIEGWRKMT